MPELGGNFRLCAVDQKRAVFSQGCAVSGLSLQEGPGASFIEKDDETYGCPYGNDVPTLRGALTGRPPYREALRGGTVLTGRAGPYGKGRGPLRGWVPSQRRTTFNYRKAYGKLRGGTLPELGGNFRLYAVDLPLLSGILEFCLTVFFYFFSKTTFLMFPRGAAINFCRAER